MTDEITATCLCGKARLICGRPSGTGSYCHCTDCRKSTGAAFSVAVPFEASGFQVVSGRIGSFAKVSDEGRELTRNFCLDCGAPLFGTSKHLPQTIFVKAGVIDDQSYVLPTHESWCQSKVEWATITPSLPTHLKGKA